VEYSTILYEVADNVATITLNRPHHHNAFTQQMMDEIGDVWQRVRLDHDVHAIVLRAVGEQAFCTGHDVSEYLPGSFPEGNVFAWQDPGKVLGAKANEIWKPLIVAVNGMLCGGAFYLFNDADIVICSENATFFDPHVSYGQVAGAEPIGLAWRIPIGEAMRLVLSGLDERVSAERAYQVGLVSEVVPLPKLWERAHDIASRIAEKHPAAIQGTVRAVWESFDTGRTAALRMGLNYCNIGNPISMAEVDRAEVVRPVPHIR
jgi:enoyl-CoA hydratase/carnithine racemase